MTFQAVLKRPPGMTSREWYKISKEAKPALKASTPVDTGRLKAGWQDPVITERRVYVDNKEPYAEYVQHGRKVIHPKPNGPPKGTPLPMTTTDMVGKAQHLLDLFAKKIDIDNTKRSQK